jgi:hypothetical protein
VSAGAIRRAVGRVVRARGAAAIFHFMPLKPFHLDPAQEASAIVALRARRLTGSDALSGSLPIADWLERLAIPQIAAVCRNLAGRSDRLVEVSSGAGLLFEAMKSAWSGPRFPDFVFVAPESDQAKFDLLHWNDAVAYRFGDFDAADIDARTVVVLNQLQAQRYGVEISDAVIERVLAGPGSPVLALTVARDRGGERLTVAGHRFAVPALPDAVDRFRRLRPDLRFVIQRRPDAGFFLPAHADDKTETLIAFPDGAGAGIDGVKPI